MNINEYPTLTGEFRDIPGIYMIYNSVTGDYYIGSSLNLLQRKYGHLQKLGAGVHTNQYLQAAFKKYGKEVFSFLVLKVEVSNFLVECEQYYLDIFKPVYNLNKRAGNSLYKSEKERSSRLGLRGRKITQWTTTGEKVQDWSSINQAINSFGLRTCGALYQCLKGKGKTALGYKWTYADTILDDEDEDEDF